MIDEEKKKMRSDPYNYVQNWMEETLMHVGKRAFSVLALLPGSLILPEIPFGASRIKSSLNTLLIAPPGSGKSTIARKFASISYFPLQRRVISSAELSQKAVEMKMLTLIIEDFSQTGADYETIKVLEGILGDEQSVMKSNMRVELLGDVRAVGLLEGTPIDLERYAESMEGGLLSRCVLVLISLDSRQHGEIGDYVNAKIGNSEHSEKLEEIEQVVIDYYKELQRIQSGQHEIKPITKYKIKDEFKDEIGKKWKALSTKLMAELGDKYFIRDLHNYYKFLISSAFLNIHNREHAKGILVPNEDDHKIAMNLMIQNMKYKWAIEKSLMLNQRIKSPMMLREMLNSGQIPEAVLSIFANISPYWKSVKDNMLT